MLTRERYSKVKVYLHMICTVVYTKVLVVKIFDGQPCNATVVTCSRNTVRENG